jgi:hypothetical protein
MSAGDFLLMMQGRSLCRRDAACEQMACAKGSHGVTIGQRLTWHVQSATVADRREARAEPS